MRRDVPNPKQRGARRVGVWAAAIVSLLVVAYGALTYFAYRDSKLDPVTYAGTELLDASSPVRTAVELSRRGWDDCDSVVLADVDDAAAAIVAGPFAAAQGAPVLVTDGDGLEREVADRIDELGAKRVIVVRTGENAEKTLAGLDGAGLDTEVVEGRDRFELAEKVAVRVRTLELSDGVALAAAPDARAVALSAFAAARGIPVLFADDGRIPLAGDSAKKLAPAWVVIVGGEDDVPASALAAAGWAPPTVQRVDQKSATAFTPKFAEYAFGQGSNYSTTFVVSDSEWAHALALPALIGHAGTGDAPSDFASSLLVVEDASLGADAETFLTTHASAVKTFVLLGENGTDLKRLAKKARVAAATKISRNAVIVTGAVGDALVSVDGAEIVFKRTREVRDRIRKGSVLVSDRTGVAPDGFLVRVTAVRRSGDNIVVSTVLASLNEVVLKGSLDARMDRSEWNGEQSTVSLGGARLVRTAVGQTWSSETTHPLGPDGEVTIGSDLLKYPVKLSKMDESEEKKSESEKKKESLIKPEFSVAPKVKLASTMVINVSYTEVERWKYSIIRLWDDETKSRMDSLRVEVVTVVTKELKFTATAKFDKLGFDPYKDIKKLKDSRAALARKRGYTGYQLGFFTFFIGPVPVPTAVVLEPEVSFKTELAANIEFELTQVNTCTVGFEWRRFGADHIDGFASSTDPRTDWRFTLSGSATAKATAQAKLAVRFFRSAGPYVTLGVQGKAEGTAKALGFGSDKAIPPIDPLNPGFDAKVQAGLAASVGGELKILETSLADISWSPSDKWLERHGLMKTFFEWPEDESGTGKLPSESSSSTPAGGDGTFDVVIVLDQSGSMGDEVAPDVTKLDNAIAAAQAVVDVLGDAGAAGTKNRVGLVTFNDGVEENVPLSSAFGDMSDLLGELESLGSTQFSDGLNQGVAHAVSGAAERTIILLVSDGEPTDGMDTFEEVRDQESKPIDRVKAAGIPIYTLGYGMPPAGRLLLKRIAEETGGEFYPEESAEDVTNVIGRRLVRATALGRGEDVIAEKDARIERGESGMLTSFDVEKAKAGQALDVEVVVGARDRDTDIWVVDPDGDEVDTDDEDVTLRRGSAATVISIPRAKVGRYRVYAKASDAARGASADGETEDAKASSEVGAYVVVAAGSSEGEPRPRVTGAGQVGEGALPGWAVPAWLALGVLLAVGVIAPPTYGLAALFARRG